MSDTFRVWLEPGFDGGGVAAWMLDLPGAFAHRTDESEALAQAPLAAWLFADRMRDHGEEMDPGGDVPDIVERVPAYRRADGYEVNAIFAIELRPTEHPELEAAIRRLDGLRADLLALLDRIAAFERDFHSLPVPDGARPLRAVLVHVGESEPWFASRLEGSLRYEGAASDGDIDAFLAGTHAWAVAQLRALQAGDPARTRTDGKGERWTMAKVLRRIVYHAADHLDELERRLDIAEGIADRLHVRREPPDVDSLAELLIASNLRRRAGDREQLARMLRGSTETVSLYNGTRLVAFARSLTDGSYNAYVSTVAVHPRYGGRGVGRRVMNELMRGRDDIKWVLEARPGVERFYASLGYEPAPGAMVRKRTR